jgi:hypothetical protein
MRLYITASGDILSDVNYFVDAVEAKKVKNPDTKSFDIVKKMCRDKFTKARLQFIISIGNVGRDMQIPKPV